MRGQAGVIGRDVVDVPGRGLDRPDAGVVTQPQQPALALEIPRQSIAIVAMGFAANGQARGMGAGIPDPSSLLLELVPRSVCNVITLHMSNARPRVDASDASHVPWSSVRSFRR